MWGPHCVRWSVTVARVVKGNFFLLPFASTFIDKCHFVEAAGALQCGCCAQVFTHGPVKVYPERVHFYLTNVYGPPTWEGKEFCDELSNLKGVCGGLWVICGDFNLTRNPSERRSRRWCGRLVTMFTYLINNLEMTDMSIGNQNYTWSNLQCTPTLASLDRFLISPE